MVYALFTFLFILLLIIPFAMPKKNKYRIPGWAYEWKDDPEMLKTLEQDFPDDFWHYD